MVVKVVIPVVMEVSVVETDSSVQEEEEVLFGPGGRRGAWHCSGIMMGVEGVAVVEVCCSFALFNFWSLFFAITSAQGTARHMP